MSEFFLSIPDALTTLKIINEGISLKLLGFSMCHVLELQRIAFYYSVHTSVSTEDAWEAFYKQACAMAKIGIHPFEILTDIKKYARVQKPKN